MGASGRLGGRARAPGRGTGSETQCASSRIGSQPRNRRPRRSDETRTGSPRLGGPTADSIRRRSPGSRGRWTRSAPRPQLLGTRTAESTNDKAPASRWSRPFRPRMFGFEPPGKSWWSAPPPPIVPNRWTRKLAETLNERHQLRRQLEQIQDEAKRERLEYEATVAELQAQLSQASLTHAQAAACREAHPKASPPSWRSSCESGPCVSILWRSINARRRNGTRNGSSVVCRDYGAGPARDEVVP